MVLLKKGKLRLTLGGHELLGGEMVIDDVIQSGRSKL